MPIPRLTYCPSRSSCAARMAICSRVNMSRTPPGRGLWTRGAALDALFVRTDHDAVHVDAGRMDPIGRHLSHLDQLFDLGDGDPARHRAQGIEVARRQTVLQIARTVGTPGLDDGPVRADAALQHVLAAVEFAYFLVLGHQGANARRGEESRNA